MSRAGKPRSRVRDFLALAGAGLLPVPWMVVHHYPGLGLAPELVALLSGLAILGGAFLLSWATELAEHLYGAADSGDTNFRGTYVLFSWMLTGELHPYNGTTGMFERLVPLRPVSIRDGTWGAWELGQRLSFLDLTEGPVRGGEMLTLASGITWHLNSQFRLFANYVFAHVTDGVENGDASIFQARIEIGI